MRKTYKVNLNGSEMNYNNTKSNGLTLESNSAKNKSRFDKLDMLILAELLRKPDIKSSEVSNKLKIPLSTIRRRRARINRASTIKRDYVIDYKQMGFRRADILIDVSKGDCIDIAKKIVKHYAENVLEASIRIGDPKINLVLEVIYNTTDEIFDIIQHIKKMEHVEDVRWSEIIQAVVKNETQIMQKLISTIEKN